MSAPTEKRAFTAEQTTAYHYELRVKKRAEKAMQEKDAQEKNLPKTTSQVQKKNGFPRNPIPSQRQKKCLPNKLITSQRPKPAGLVQVGRITYSAEELLGYRDQASRIDSSKLPLVNKSWLIGSEPNPRTHQHPAPITRQSNTQQTSTYHPAIGNGASKNSDNTKRDRVENKTPNKSSVKYDSTALAADKLIILPSERSKQYQVAHKEAYEARCEKRVLRAAWAEKEHAVDGSKKTNAAQSTPKHQPSINKEQVMPTTPQKTHEEKEEVCMSPSKSDSGTSDTTEDSLGFDSDWDDVDDELFEIVIPSVTNGKVPSPSKGQIPAAQSYSTFSHTIEEGSGHESDWDNVDDAFFEDITPSVSNGKVPTSSKGEDKKKGWFW